MSDMKCFFWVCLTPACTPTQVRSFLSSFARETDVRFSVCCLEEKRRPPYRKFAYFVFRPQRAFKSSFLCVMIAGEGETCTVLVLYQASRSFEKFVRLEVCMSPGGGRVFPHSSFMQVLIVTCKVDSHLSVYSVFISALLFVAKTVNNEVGSVSPSSPSPCWSCSHREIPSVNNFPL